MTRSNTYRQSPEDTEYLEVVDAMNKPIGVLSREEVHLQGLFHRSVLVLVYDRDYRLLIQQRHHAKKVYPGRWDLSATGHVLAGESSLDAAYRELQEEVGIIPSRLKHVTTINGNQDTNYEFVSLFSAGRQASMPSPNPLEVEDFMFLNLEDMNTLVAEFPDLVTPGLVYFWRKGLLFPKL